ncbi:S46 family peptidase [Chitinophaga nivalis]|uniref:Dipeptidyl-peptidase n=1 Tax=Chitinophaga nivalis TaxID=2991709 RepID=A0ABT3IPX7_9BACT|nr:S46 family peptidase [Chitinophaga nivalis]MCW3464283.1 S46 family peptidase [Chitinophaga nivalis]MCW3486026.1 S46 family peptidase [Chitinophaga nivalis]
MLQRIVKPLLVLALLALTQYSYATEGMWLPQLLSGLNEKEMKGMGMKISAADIYNINKGSLKDAIVSFGGFCTAEVISTQGLLLTNHHCGYGVIQKHSSLQNNFLENGFWAKTAVEELPNPGLFATFIVRIDDVTKAALQDVQPGMTEKERQSAIDKRLHEIRQNARKESWQETMIKPMFEGNQYFLFVTETYRDVRLVGAPPSSIGKFGSDTDNWVWPRHTGDFSMFRIYAGKDGRPAPYSKDNVPLKPKHALPISMKGVKQNDFTMVLGFPGRTNEYLPSEAVKQTVEVTDAAKVEMRDAALKIMDSYMRKDPQIKIQYAAKYASTANYWKKWMGEMQGVKQTNGIARKQQYEATYRQLLAGNPTWQQQYGGVLDSLNSLYRQIQPYAQTRDYYSELVGNVELFTVSDKLLNFLSDARQKGEGQYETLRSQFLESMAPFYQNYNATVDKDICVSLLALYAQGVPARFSGNEYNQIWQVSNKDSRALANQLYAASALTSMDKLKALLQQPLNAVVAQVWKDPAAGMAIALRNGFVENVSKPLNELQLGINKLQRTYMQAQIDVMGSKKRFYPDANSTLRVTYGKADGYTPRDGVRYDFYTYLDGVMEKYIPGDYEFDVPARLIELYKKKDYGQYGVNGKMPVCFIASNHTTGGNSGSPALNANGHLIGLNFDRTWEGTMSDINYDPSICRNIMVDIRYVLFIVDKFAGCTRLIDEMNLVKK